MFRFLSKILAPGKCNSDTKSGLFSGGPETREKLHNLSVEIRNTAELGGNDNQDISPSNLHNQHALTDITKMCSVEHCVYDDAITDDGVVRQVLFPCKRKQESFSGMLNWLNEFTDPNDAAFEKIDQAYKKKKYSGQEFKGVERNATPPTEIEHGHHPRPSIPTGSRFQAEIPVWTGMALESDLKWLGTPYWQLSPCEDNLFVERGPIGKGRQDSCECRDPGTVDCVRFHIAEEKRRLKSELGLIFYTWRFHCMGEEVSKSWTEEEEKKFRDTVRANPRSRGKTLWNQLCKFFSTRRRQDLVSYYFNVFVLRCRTYQNRVTCCSIDSDDDELETASSLGEVSSNEVLTVSASKDTKKQLKES